MRMSLGGMVRGLTLASAAMLLAACGGGGGGGSGGGIPGGPTPANEYVIELSADRDALPLNIAGVGPSIGGPYTTTLYVQAFRRNTRDPIPGGEGVFSCNIVSGLASGALYYLDGNSDHEDDDGNPRAYRAVVLDANAGAASFHFHAGGTVDSGTIRCSVTDPQTNMSKTATLAISVGGTSTGRPSQVVQVAASQDFLFAQGFNGPTQMVLQVNVVDEAGQLVSGTNSLQASIVSSIPGDPLNTSCAAGVGARLRSGTNTAQSVFASAVNGQAQFTVVSGTTWSSNICLMFVADRADNNVANGVQEPVLNYVSIPVVRAVASEALAVATDALPGAFLNTPYFHFLTATGGVPPYSWSLASGAELPPGLTLSSDGVISGTPTSVGANFGFAVTVTDSVGVSMAKVLSLSVSETGGAGVTIATTSLPGGTVQVSYQAALLAAGGLAPYAWSMSPSQVSGLTLSSAGVLSGTPADPGTFAVVITATDSRGFSTNRQFNITIAPEPAP